MPRTEGGPVVSEASTTPENDQVARFLGARAPLPIGGRQGARRARSKLAAGQPLLHDEPLTIDESFVVALASSLLQWSFEQGDPTALAALAALREQRTDLPRIVEEAFVGHRDHLEQLTAHAGGSRRLLHWAFERASRPLLTLAAESVREHLAGANWHRTYCPVCGSSGIILEPGRLFCSRCATIWSGSIDVGDPGYVLELRAPGESEAQDWRDD